MSLCVEFKQLPGRIERVETGQEFADQFRRMFTSKDASAAVNVVYTWRTGDSIPRLRGKSDIIYIGKTKSSLRQRHGRYAAVEGSDLNWKRYEHILKTYGPIWVEYKNVAKNVDLREEEKRVLREYFCRHLEYPPLNRSS